MSSAGRAGGFSLLEALVAMALIGLVGVALLSWLDTNLISANRIRAANDQTLLARNALELVAGINPISQRNGTVRVPPLTVRWQADPVMPPRTSWGLEGPGRYRVGLFKVSVDATDGSGGTAAFTLLRLGYEITY